jgi:malate permease and related proteins
VIAVAATIVVSLLVGVGAEQRFAERAQAWARTVLTVTLYGLLPFVVFFNIARLHVSVDLAAALGLAIAVAALVALLAWLVATRVLRVARPTAGSMMVSSIQGNTGYLGLPVTFAVLGAGALGNAIAYDTIMSAVTLLIGAAAIGAALGERVGEGGGRARVRSFVARNPPLIAVVLGLLAPDALAPEALVDVSHVLAVGLAPLGFFALGAILAGEAEHGVLGLPGVGGNFLTAPIGAAVTLKVLVTPLLLLAITAPLVDLPRAFLLQSAMPCGINGLVIAHAYGLDLRTSAGAIAWSTAIVVVAATIGAVL